MRELFVLVRAQKKKCDEERYGGRGVKKNKKLKEAEEAEQGGKKQNNEQPLCCGFMHFVQLVDSTVSTVQFTAAIFHMRFQAYRCSQPAWSPDIFTI